MFLNFLKFSDVLELQGRVCRVLASFEGWQTAAWDLRKRTLPRPQELVGAAGKVCRGLSIKTARSLVEAAARDVQANGRLQPWSSKDKAGSTPPVFPGAAPALAKARVGGYLIILMLILLQQ